MIFISMAFVSQLAIAKKTPPPTQGTSFFEIINSELPVYDRPIIDITQQCKKENIKVSICEDYEKSKIKPSDLIFDCKIVNDDCAPGEQLATSKEGHRYRYVAYYRFENGEYCDDIDRNNDDRSFAENAKIIFKNGLNHDLPFSKIYEQVARYLASPYSDGKGNKVSRSHCLKVQKGWVSDHFIKKAKIENHPIYQVKTQVAQCEDCDLKADVEIKSGAIKNQKAYVRDLLKRVAAEEVLQQEINHEKLRSCEGTVHFANISIDLSKNPGLFSSGGDKQKGPKCEVSFPKGCGTGPLGHLEYIEQISNSIFLSYGSQTDDAKRTCRQAVNAYIQKCGINKELPSAGSLEKFSEVRKNLGRILEKERKNFGITEGAMMCIYHRETLNFDGTKVNTDGCGPRNMNNIRKPGLVREDDFVFKGWTSSASGLGQVTLETACYAIQKYTEHYGNAALKLQNMRCNTPEAKKIVENYFITVGQSEYMQILLSIDVLRMKLSETGNLYKAVFNYGDGKQTYPQFIQECSKCFGPKVSDAEALKCANAKRNLIFKNQPEQEASAGTVREVMYEVR